MKQGIHPEYVDTQVTCTCGNTFTTRSTAKNGVMHAEVCAACHPFYTGKQKILDTGGRVARFEQRYAKKKLVSPTPGARSRPGPRRLCVGRSGGRPCSRPRGLREEFAELEQQLADPAIHSDLAASRRIGRRYAELTPIVKALAAHGQLTGDLAAARELAEDPAFAEEADAIAAELAEVEERLTRLLAPRDPNDSADCLIEIKSGEGGEESALFAGDLLRMYTRYAETRGWKVEVLDSQETDLGGYKSITLAIQGRFHGRPRQHALRGAEVRGRRAPGAAGAGHRVPGTGAHLGGRRAGDARGRGHRDRDQRRRPADRRLSLVRARRSGRQHHRLRRPDHPPADRHRGLLPERALPAAEQGVGDAHAAGPAGRRPLEEAEAEASAARRSQVRTVDRSERIRTYNFPENRIADHRIGFKAYNLDQVLDLG